MIIKADLWTVVAILGTVAAMAVAGNEANSDADQVDAESQIRITITRLRALIPDFRGTETAKQAEKLLSEIEALREATYELKRSEIETRLRELIEQSPDTEAAAKAKQLLADIRVNDKTFAFRINTKSGRLVANVFVDAEDLQGAKDKLKHHNPGCEIVGVLREEEFTKITNKSDQPLTYQVKLIYGLMTLYAPPVGQPHVRWNVEHHKISRLRSCTVEDQTRIRCHSAHTPSFAVPTQVRLRDCSKPKSSASRDHSKRGVATTKV